jgi:hypothetical protein
MGFEKAKANVWNHSLVSEDKAQVLKRLRLTFEKPKS